MAIRLEPSQLDDYAVKVDNERDSLENVLSNLNSIAEFLEQNWEGQASTKFVGEYNEVKQVFPKLISTMEDVASNLRTHAENFRTADSK